MHQWTEEEVLSKEKLIRQQSKNILFRGNKRLDISFLEDLQQAAWEEVLRRSSPTDPSLSLICNDGINDYVSYWKRGVCRSATERHLKYQESSDQLEDYVHQGLGPEASSILREYIYLVYAISDARTRWLWLAQYLNYERGRQGKPRLERRDYQAVGLSDDQVSRLRTQLISLAKSIQD